MVVEVRFRRTLLAILLGAPAAVTVDAVVTNRLGGRASFFPDVVSGRADHDTAVFGLQHVPVVRIYHSVIPQIVFDPEFTAVAPASCSAFLIVNPLAAVSLLAVGLVLVQALAVAGRHFALMLIAELVNAVSQVRPALAPAYGLVELLIVGVAVRLSCSRVGAQALARRRVCYAGDAGRELARGSVAPAVAVLVIGDKPGAFRGVGGLRTGITVFLCRKLLAVAFATELRQHVIGFAGLGILGPVVARALALLLVKRGRRYAVVVSLVAPSAVAGVLEYGAL